MKLFSFFFGEGESHHLKHVGLLHNALPDGVAVTAQACADLGDSDSFHTRSSRGRIFSVILLYTLAFFRALWYTAKKVTILQRKKNCEEWHLRLGAFHVAARL